MDHQSPLTFDEVCFTKRLLFETLNFNEPIENSAEPGFSNLGLSNGAIENFLRVMKACGYDDFATIEQGQEPPKVDSCPWVDQASFLQRVSELQGWLDTNGGEPCDVEPFIYEDKRDLSPRPRKPLFPDQVDSKTRQNEQ